MPSLIAVMIKDPGGNLLLTLNVPLDYTPARLLADLVEASDLDLVEPSGNLLRYELTRTDGKTIPTHQNFFTVGLLRGESLILRQIRTGRRAPRPALQALQQARLELEEDLDYIDNRASQRQQTNQPVSYWKDALRWQVCQLYEPALQILLEKRQELIDSLNNPPPSSNRGGGGGTAVLTADPAWTRNEIGLLTNEIVMLFREALGSQLSISGYEPFEKMLNLPATVVFFNGSRQFKDEVIEMLTRGSYMLGRQQRYMEARDFATLAKKLAPGNDIAVALEWMAQTYLSFKAAVDPEDRLELARSIYGADETYGNIANDLREAVKETREGPNKPLGRGGPGNQDQQNYGGYHPGYQPGGPPAYYNGNRPPRPKKKSLIAVLYPYLLGLFGVVIVAFMLYWILVPS